MLGYYGIRYGINTESDLVVKETPKKRCVDSEDENMN